MNDSVRKKKYIFIYYLFLPKPLFGGALCVWFYNFGKKKNSKEHLEIDLLKRVTPDKSFSIGFFKLLLFCFFFLLGGLSLFECGNWGTIQNWDQTGKIL